MREFSEVCRGVMYTRYSIRYSIGYSRWYSIGICKVYRGYCIKYVIKISILMANL